MEIEFVKYPIQSLIGDQEIYKRIKNNIDSITTFTLELWFRVIKKYRIKKETKVLRWVAFDSNFKSD